MLIADALSRAYLKRGTAADFSEEVAAVAAAAAEQRDALRMVASPATIELLRRAAEVDDEYQLLRRQIALGWPQSPADVPVNLRQFMTFSDELAEFDGLVYKGHRVVVPRDARAEILDRIHSSHIGVNGCLRRAKEAVYYPNITSDIKKTIAACQICESFQHAVQKEPLMPHAAPSRPWEKVGVDIFTYRGQDYLITVDYLSNYFEVDRLPSKRISDIIYVLKQIFARYGIPLELVSDNSPFNSAEFKAFAGRWEFTHVTYSPHYSQSNGKSESAVKQAKRLMQKAHEDRSDPYLTLLALRNTPSESLGLSPAQIMFNRRTRTTLPMAQTLLSSAHDHDAHDALVQSKQRQAVYYNRGAKERPPLKVGDTVRTRWQTGGEWEKAKVNKVLPHRSYELQMRDGSTRRRTTKHVRFSRETPVIVSDEGHDVITPATPAPHPPLTDAGGSASGGVDARRPPPPPSTSATSTPTLMTKSGRPVRRPARYADYLP